MRTTAFDPRFFTPAGSQAAGFLPISRRTFITALAACPALAAAAVAKPATQPHPDAPFLTFSEDSAGLTVTLHQKLQIGVDWRLPRRAFGSKAGFLLRTLTKGAEIGYEVLVYHVQFGRLHDRRYLIMFRPTGDGWDVTMRTDLWTSSYTPPANAVMQGPTTRSLELTFPVELTSTRVPFENLVATSSRPLCCWRPIALRFDVDGGAINSSIETMFEGHVASRGRMALEFDGDCVWTLNAKSGRISAFDDEFELKNLEVAWCEPLGASTVGAPATGDTSACLQGVTIAQSRSRALSDPDPSKSRIDPVFCASADAKATLAQASLGSSLAEVHLGYKWEESNSILAFSFSREDWDLVRGRGVQGVAEIRGSMAASIRARKGQRFGPLPLPQAMIRRKVIVEDKFVFLETSILGRIDTNAHDVDDSPIGPLGVRGKTATHSTRRTTTSNQPGACAADEDMTFNAVFRRVGGTRQPRSADRLQSIDVDFLLLRSDLAPSDAEHSSLEFSDAEVRAFYRIDRTQNAADWQTSYLWLGEGRALQRANTTGAAYQRPVAIIDLSRARLEVARSSDLLSLAFMFADLDLEVGPDELRMTPRTAQCRVLPRGRVARRDRATAKHGTSAQHVDAVAVLDDGVTLDSRPTLVVEFPPQHMFEEAIFRPNDPDLPDVVLEAKTFSFEWNNENQVFSTSPMTFLAQIAPFDEQIRAAARRKYAELKESATPKNNGDKSAANFKAFRTDLEHLFESDSPPWLPTDQKVYIGPYGMDPDVAGIARWAARASLRSRVEESFDATLAEVNAVRDGMPASTGAKPSRLTRLAILATSLFNSMRESSVADPEGDLAIALSYETALSAVSPDYAFFRDYYRSEMTKLLLVETNRPSPKPYEDLAPADRPTSSTIDELEYYCEKNRKWLDDNGSKSKVSKAVLEKRDLDVRRSYTDVLMGKEELPELTRARLANPSRLAFRVDCTPKNGSSPNHSTQQTSHIAFSIAGLTDWSTYEPAVVPRAFALVGDDIGEDDDQSPSTVDATRMLTRLGFRSGRYVTAQERLSDLETSLRAPPGPLETCIEIPARLILSPSQRAVWGTPSNLAARVFRELSKNDSATKKTTTRDNSYSPAVLWTADLRTRDPEPGLRAVYSPDLRPGFVHRGVERAVSKRDGLKDTSNLRIAGAAAPPRGPRAPWTLGIDDGDPGASKLEDIYKSITKTKDDDFKGIDDLCKRVRNAEKAAKERGTGAAKTNEADSKKRDQAKGNDKGKISDEIHFHPLVRYLCERRDAVTWLRSNPREQLFRTSLDAYDRHELVLLSSAWGMPVRGRRGADGEISPFGTSSQVEAPKEFTTIDIEDTSALYVPRALRLQELRLSALGGTLRHDTTFVPPAAALHIGYGALFDALSIERWQHWVVLGRDVFSEVVYKGFLFPIGHRASLIKQTERVFLRRRTGEDVRAYLRQRMFIRIGQPTKSFPALGHPNDGRQFPVDAVRILTVNTPDIVDPTQDMPRGESIDSQDLAPTSGGRLFMNMPGLVFWPRTVRLDGYEVRFDMQIDEMFTSLPMIFVDNVAAHDPGVLASLITYYNNTITSPDNPETASMSGIDAVKHKRTLDFADQVQRYCDEVKPGESSHKTSAWTLKALGGVDTGPIKNTPDFNGDWEGSNTFFTDPLLEGADQPPFYPAIETARIRVDQVERFTGNTNEKVLVQFDGFYVANGFNVPSLSTSANTQTDQVIDKLEIYLDILSPLTMTMGPSGDRSGGVFRPESRLVALCRTRGPLAGLPRALVRPESGRSTLFTRVNDYRDDQQPANNGPATAQSGATVPVTEPRAPKSYESYFQNAPREGGGDVLATKLFGLVKLSDLVKFCATQAADKGLPALQEAVQYGTSQVAETSEAIRTRVVVPLSKVVDQMRRKLVELEARLPKQDVAPIRLQDVFPDVYSALAALQAALNTSVASPQGAQFLASLAGIYEAGRRLVDALDRASTSLPERVGGVALKKLGAPFEDFASGLIAWAQRLNAWLGAPDRYKQLAETLAEHMTGAPVDRARFFPFPYEHFTRGTLMADAVQAKLLLREQDIRTALTMALMSVLMGTRAETAIKQFLQEMVDKAIKAADQAREAARQPGFGEDVFLLKYFFKYSAERVETLQKLDSYVINLRRTRAELAQGRIPSELVPVEAAQSMVFKAVGVLGGSRSISLERVSSLAGVVKTFIEGFTVAPVTSEILKDANVGGLLADLIKNLHDTATKLGGKDPGVLTACRNITDPFAKDVSQPWPRTVTGASLTNSLFKFASAAQTVLNQGELDPLIEKAIRESVLAALSAGCALANTAAEMQQLLGPLEVKTLESFDIQQFIRACARRTRALEETGQMLRRMFPAQLPDNVSLKESIDRDLGDNVRRILTDVLELEGSILSYYEAKVWADTINALNSTDFAPKPLARDPALFADTLKKARETLETASSALENLRNKRWSELVKLNAAQVVPDPLQLLSLKFASSLSDLYPIDDFAAALTEAWRQRLLAVEAESGRKMSEYVAKLFVGGDDPAQPSLLQLYATSVAARKTAYDAVPPQIAPLRALLLVKVDKPIYPGVKVNPSLTPDSDQLYYDMKSLEEVREYSKKNFFGVEKRVLIGPPRDFVIDLLRGWEQGDSSPLRILAQAKRFAIDGAREQLLRLVDFSGFREAIDQEITQLLPVSTSVAYDYSLKLTERAKEATKGVFCPRQDCELRIHSAATVNFLTKNASFAANGEIGAFDIHLVGEFDAVTLMFNGATFRSSDGGPMKCDVQYKDFKIGQQLKFLQDLAGFFGPKQGSGFYLQLLSGGLGLEAGYGLNIGTISVATISFFNISLNAAVRLRFDGEPSSFVASLSRRDSPFTISAAPYGGSGFFAIEATAQGIVGFEASFEYGGAAAFAYGPLQGQGRLMMGVYVRRKYSQTDIWGTFYVGGSASIWIFTFGASLYVCASMQASKMVGDATFTFSFSMGLCDFSYSVQVHYEQQWSGGTKTADAGSGAMDEPTMLAQADYGWDGRRTLSDAGSGYWVPGRRPINTRTGKKSRKAFQAAPSRGPVPAPDHTCARIRANTYCQGDDWGRHRDYFDFGLKVDTGFDP